MVDVAQLVRASDCGSEGRGFEPHPPPINESLAMQGFRYLLSIPKKIFFQSLSRGLL